VLECVVNVSEGRDAAVIEAVAAAAGDCLLDVHTDADHHRSVLTMAGPDLEDAVRAVATEAVRRIDLRRHEGVHPRMGAVDVVPFVPVAVAERDRFAEWAAAALAVPCFVYGPERSLPDVRRRAFVDLAPDTGPPEPHPTAGAMCVGTRPFLVAYNVWLTPGTPLDVARKAAARLRSPAVRALGLAVGPQAQVSMNLLDPTAVTPADVYDAVAAEAPIERAELVGLTPANVLAAVAKDRWAALDLDPSKTIEARLGAATAKRWRRSRDGGRGTAGDEAAGAPAR
jgi:glutamate formiminotransferase